MTKQATIKTGDRLYNRGDMANPEHWVTVVSIDAAKGTMQVLPDAGEYHHDNEYRLYLCSVSTTDSGNGSTRIVTEAAFRARRDEQIAEFKKMAARLAAKRQQAS